MKGSAKTDSLAHAREAPALRLAGVCRVVLIMVLAGAYANTLHVPFLMDDASSIANNDSITSVGTALNPPHDSGVTVSGRPVVNVTLALSYAMSERSTVGYHAINLAIHMASAVLLSLVASMILARGPGRRQEHALTGVAIAALWALHPLQTESVTYIVQRAEALAGFFYLAGFYCFLKAMEADRRIPWLAASWVCCALGMATKEVMVSAPLMLFWFDGIFVEGSLLGAWRKRRGFHLAMALTWCVLLACIFSSGLRGGTVGTQGLVTVEAYARTQFYAIGRYLCLSFWPHPLVFDYGTQLVSSWGQVLPQIILVLSLFAWLVYAIKRHPRLAWLTGLFFCALAPTSSLVPVITQTIAEHRMYLALVAPMALLVLGLVACWGERGLWICAVLAVGLALATYNRNNDYSSAEVLWRDTANKRPSNPRAWCSLAMVLSENGKHLEALSAIQHAVELAPDNLAVLVDVAMVEDKMGNKTQAVASLHKVNAGAPRYYESRHVLGSILLEINRPEEAVEELNRAIELNPRNAADYYNLGNARVALGHWDEAIRQYKQAVKLAPYGEKAWKNLALTLIKVGSAVEAEHLLSEAIRKFPKSVDLKESYALALEAQAAHGKALAVLRLLELQNALTADGYAYMGLTLVGCGRLEEGADAYEKALELGAGGSAPAERRGILVSAGELWMKLSKPAAAVACFRKAANLEPGNIELKQLLAGALVESHEYDMASTEFIEILRAQPDNALVHNSLGAIYMIKGDLDRARVHLVKAVGLRPDFSEAKENLRAIENLGD